MKSIAVMTPIALIAGSVVLAGAVGAPASAAPQPNEDLQSHSMLKKKAKWKWKNLNTKATPDSAGIYWTKPNDSFWLNGNRWLMRWNSVSGPTSWARLNLKTKNMTCKRIQVTATAVPNYDTSKTPGVTPVYPVQIVRGTKVLAQAGAPQGALGIEFAASGKAVKGKNVSVIVNRPQFVRYVNETRGNVFVSVRGFCK